MTAAISRPRRTCAHLQNPPSTYDVLVSKELVQILVAVIAGLALLITKLIETRQGRRSERSGLAADVALLKELPDDSEARSALLTHIDKRILSMTADDGLSRHWFGVVLSVIFLGLAAWLGYAAYAAWPTWWWAIPLAVIAFVCLVIFIAGLAGSLPRRKRGPDGAEIKDPTSD